VHALDEVDLLLILALVARAVATAVDTNEQWGRFVTFHQPKVEVIALMRSVDDVDMCGFQLWPICFPFQALLFETPALR